MTPTPSERIKIDCNKHRGETPCSGQTVVTDEEWAGAGADDAARRLNLLDDARRACLGGCGCNCNADFEPDGRTLVAVAAPGPKSMPA